MMRCVRRNFPSLITHPFKNRKQLLKVFWVSLSVRYTSYEGDMCPNGIRWSILKLSFSKEFINWGTSNIFYETPSSAFTNPILSDNSVNNANKRGKNVSKMYYFQDAVK